MRKSVLTSASALVLAGAALLVTAQHAAAGVLPGPLITVPDNYYGALDTYNNPGDVIGDSTFQVTQATGQRVMMGGVDTLQIVVYTNFAGAPLTAAADGTNYGSLFLNTGTNLLANGGVWDPTGSASDHYATDTYVPNEFNYAVTTPAPSVGSQSYTNVAAGTYAVGTSTGQFDQPGTAHEGGNGTNGSFAEYYTTSTGGKVVLSNVDNTAGNDSTDNWATYPNNGGSGFYFRSEQAVQFVPASNAVSAYTTLVSVNATAGTITYDIEDNGALGSTIAFDWAMTCANDVIQGQFTGLGNPTLQGGVPEIATWSMMIIGFGMIGLKMRRNGTGQATAV